MKDKYMTALNTVQCGIILDILQTKSKALINNLTHDTKFLYDIFHAGLSSPAGMIVAMYMKGFHFLLKVLSIFKLKMGYEYSTSSSGGGGAGSPPSPRTGPKGPAFKYSSKISPIKSRQSVSLLAVKELTSIIAPIQNPLLMVATPHVTAKIQPTPITVPPLPVMKRNKYSSPKVVIRNIGLCFALIIMAPENLKTVVKPSEIVLFVLSKTQALISFIQLKFDNSKIEEPIGTSLSTKGGDRNDALILKQEKNDSKGCTFLRKIARTFF